MKKLMVVGISLCMVYGTAMAQAVNTVTVQFAFTKQSGFASNQFALWLEDAQGQYIKTIYTTQFTATGGWRKREQSLPLWVKQSRISSKPQGIDVMTGATPKSGVLTYRCAMTDSTNRPLPSGEYRIMVEASLRNENRVIYTVVVRTGGSGGQVSAQAQYFGTSTEERGMIGAVTVKYE